MGGSSQAAVHQDVRSEPERQQCYGTTTASVTTGSTAQWMGNAAYEHGTCILCRPQYEDHDMGRPTAAFIIRPECPAVQARLQAKADLLPVATCASHHVWTVPRQGQEKQHLRGLLR